MKDADLLQAILFIFNGPVAIKQLSIWKQLDPAEIQAYVEKYKEWTDSPAAGNLPVPRRGTETIICASSGRELVERALETLTIVAYQPSITRQEIDEICGVRSIYSIFVFFERRLVEKTGTKEVIGRPLLYGTTTAFLSQFSLKLQASCRRFP